MARLQEASEAVESTVRSASYFSSSLRIPADLVAVRDGISRSPNPADPEGEPGPCRAIDAPRFYGVGCGMRPRLVTPKT